MMQPTLAIDKSMIDGKKRAAPNEKLRRNSKGKPGKMLRKQLSLHSRNLVLQSRWFSGIIGTSEGTSTPGAPSMNLLHVRQQREHALVSQRYVDDTVVNESAERVLDRLFLAASLSSDRDENPGVLPGKSTGGPQTTSRIPERLPLGRIVSESGGDSKEESVVGGEDVWCDDRVV